MTCPASPSSLRRAKGTKCARSWKILAEVGSDPEFPELSPRDAEAVRQFDARHPRPRSRPMRKALAVGTAVAARAWRSPRSSLLLDQANKAWMLYVYDIGAKGTVTLTPVLRPGSGVEPGHQLRAAAAAERAWPLGADPVRLGREPRPGRLARAHHLAARRRRIGLIIGGAIGNAIDRIVYGAVADFFSLPRLRL